MAGELEGKVALVTGGSRGIGAACARALAARGASVALTYSASAEAASKIASELGSGSRRAIAISADASDAKAMGSLIGRVVDEFGRLDILVNNAGTAVLAPITEISDDQFDRVFAINVRAPFVLCREAARVMGPGGRIINIGSVNSDRMPTPGFSAYGSSKAALRAMTQAMARDLASRGITANTVQPGPIDTELNPADGDFARVLKGFMALDRYGTADEVAALVAFLAGPTAANITGAHLDIAGGFGI